MNASTANPQSPLPAPKREVLWSKTRWLTLIVLTFAAYVAFIVAAGDRKKIVSRAVTNVPVLNLAAGANELLALTDPTLFALPHANDFAALALKKMPAIAQPSFRWTEPPRWLPLPEYQLAGTFRNFMQTNSVAGFQLEFKPSPELSAPALPVQPLITQKSTLRIEGDLAKRKILSPLELPSLPDNDVIAPTKIQALVDTAGNVVSVVPLESSGLGAADQRALEIARTLRFTSGSTILIGQIIFNWHTVPPQTNAPVLSP